MLRENSQNFLLVTSGRSQIAGAALFQDSQLIGAVRQELLTGIKNDPSYPPTASVDYVLKVAGISQAGVTQTVVVEPALGYSQHRAEAELSYAASGFNPNQRTLIAVLGLGNALSANSFWTCEQGEIQGEETLSANDGMNLFFQTMSRILGEPIEDLKQFTTKRKFFGQKTITNLEQKFRHILHEHVAIDFPTGDIYISSILEKELIHIINCEFYPLSAVRESLWVAAIDHFLHIQKELLRKKMLDMQATQLCLAGDFVLSAEFNTYMAESELPTTNEISITPFPCGIASYVGAGLAWLRDQQLLVPKIEGISWAVIYEIEEMKEAVARAGLITKIYPSDQALCEATAQLIAQGQVVGWFQGGAELGPRALGHRSVLSNYSHTQGSMRLNQVKKSTPYKETAIALDDYRAPYLFTNYHPNPYMQYLQYYTQKHLLQNPHLAIATRPHAVTEKQNRLFWQLLQYIGKKTGLPAVYKSSLNLSGKPPAENPAQALEIFQELERMDAIVLGRLLVQR